MYQENIFVLSLLSRRGIIIIIGRLFLCPRNILPDIIFLLLAYNPFVLWIKILEVLFIRLS